jgi:hypothetical protein
MNSKQIINLGKELPYGAKKLIAESTGINYTSIINFFTYGLPINKNTPKVLEVSKLFLEKGKELKKEQADNVKIGNELPYGAKKEIAEITGKTEQTINQFFKTGLASSETTAKILEASKPFLAIAENLKTAQKSNIKLGKELPHGAKKKIAEITGISQQTINKFFKTGVAGVEVTAKILEASKPFAEKYKEVLKAKNEFVNLFIK